MISGTASASRTSRHFRDRANRSQDAAPTVRLAPDGDQGELCGRSRFRRYATHPCSLHTGNIFSCPRLQQCTRSKARGAARQLSAARQGPAKAGQRWEEQRRGVEVRLVHIMCARVREVGTVRKSVPARWRLTRRAGRRWGKGGGREDGCMCAPGSAGRRRNAWQRSRRRFPPSEVSVVSRVSSNSVESVQ